MNLPAFRFRPFLLLGAVALILSGCDGGPTWNEEAPAVGPSGDVVVPKTTNVLDESMVEENLQSEPQGQFGELPDELVFSGDAPMGDVEVGDVIVTGISEQTPAGFLRTVTGRREEGGQIVLETRRGTLSEAIDRGRLDTSITLSEQTIDQERFYGPFGGKKAAQSLTGEDVPEAVAKSVGGFCSGTQDSICFQLTEEVSAGGQFGDDGAEVGIGVTYSIAQAYKPSIDLEIDIGLTGVDRIRFAVERGYRRTVGATLSAGASNELSTNIIGNRNLGRFTVFVGPVPVVVIPYIRAEGGVEFALGATGGQAFVRDEKTIENGLAYDGSNWRQIKNRDVKSSGIVIDGGPNNPFDRVSGSIEPFARIPLTLGVYGIVGPQVAAKGFLQTQFAPDEDPFWTASLGISGEVGFEFRHVDVEESQEIAQATVQIASGNNPQGEPPNPLFPPSQVTRTIGNEKITLRWADSDAAERYHVFRDRQPFSASLVEGSDVNPLVSTVTRVNSVPLQDTTFTDKGLENGTKYYYRVTAVDEEDNGTEGSVMVTGTPLPDPPDRP